MKFPSPPVQDPSSLSDTSRREFLARLAALPAGLAFSLKSLGANPKSAIGNPQALLLAQQPPVAMANAPHSRAFLFAALNSWMTPTAEFFVRSHFGIPKIEASRWTLEITGAVERPRRFTLEEILRLPSQQQIATLECSGNPVGWGGVSNARWTGVRLGALLEACGLRSDAIEIILTGADGGAELEAGGINVPAYARSIPIKKALEQNTLLAFKMNDELLPAIHGGPLRALIPGFYAMDSVKWLKRIVVSREVFKGFYHTERYYEARRINGQIFRNELHEMRIKSQIARPTNQQTLALAPVQIVGAAWTNGDAEINKVELSFNRGRSWVEAQLGEDHAPFAWRLWSFEWTPTMAGVYEITARARDTQGREQPTERDSTLITPYANNHADRHLVEVK
ncbi:MAG: sulfite oxidase [Acidobacteria bacterium]|nr:sulfite oxidase [Acidobacteriota bacterium]